MAEGREAFLTFLHQNSFMSELHRKLREALDGLHMAEKHLGEVALMPHADELRGKSDKQFVMWPNKTYRQVALEEVIVCKSRLARLEYAERKDRVQSRWYSPERMERIRAKQMPRIKPQLEEISFLTPMGIDEVHNRQKLTEF